MKLRSDTAHSNATVPYSRCNWLPPSPPTPSADGYVPTPQLPILSRCVRGIVDMARLVGRLGREVGMARLQVMIPNSPVNYNPQNLKAKFFCGRLLRDRPRPNPFELKNLCPRLHNHSRVSQSRAIPRSASLCIKQVPSTHLRPAPYV